MKLIKNKIGSHVGVIISFVIFITFLVFLFVILKPSLEVAEEKEATLNNIESLFFEYLNSNLTTISLNIDNDVTLTGQNCLKFNSVESISATGLEGNNLYVKNLANTNVGFYWQTSGSNLLTENSGQNKFFKIYASDEISSQQNTLSICQNIGVSDYSVGIVKTENGIFEKKILETMQFYKIDYSALRQAIGISSSEFDFDFVYNNGTIISAGGVNHQTDIFAKEIPINYFNSSLNNNAGSIIIKTW